jgi:butyryl-CoA dehydrogenase
MLLAQKTQVEGALALCFFCSQLVDRCSLAQGTEKADLELLLEVLTPIAKSWPAEHCLEANKLAIQILGGAGYTPDHPVERFYRDNRLNHIHEGTYGIQGIDLLGRKVRLCGGRGLALLVSRIEATIREASLLPHLAAYAADLTAALQWLDRATKAATAHPDPELGLANAALYLDAAGTVVVAWLWLWQAVVACRKLETAAPGQRAFYEAKVIACRYCFKFMLPIARIGFSLVEELDDTCFRLTPEQIEAA